MKAISCVPLICLLLWLCYGCSASTGGSAQPDGRQGAGPKVDPEPKYSSDFELTVLEESYAYGGRAELALSVDESGAETLVEVVASGANDLRALYCTIAYDPTRYAPLAAEPDARFAPAEPPLTLTVTKERGWLHYGQVKARPQETRGFTGDGALMRVRFAKFPAPAGRMASAPPVNDAAASQLSFETATFTVDWGYACTGDYDQNSEVNVADLTPIAVNFKETGPFDYWSIESVVDGDGNGEINVADITPIGANFKRSVAEYNLYAEPTLDAYPVINDAPSTVGSLATKLFNEASGAPNTGRLRFSFDLTGQPLDEFYWARPEHEELEGTPSNNAQTLGSLVLPVAVLIAVPDLGSVPLLVDFDASGSTSPLGAISNYEWDFDNDGNFAETDNGEDLATGNATAQQTYPDPGAYTVGVRVTGSFNLTDTEAVQALANVTPPVAAISGSPLSGTAPLTVDFDASASVDPDGSIVNYEWDYDGDGTFDGSTGSTPTVSFEFLIAGNYNTTVRVTDNHGAFDTASLAESGGGQILVDPNQLPTAAISGAPTTGKAPLTVDFDASSSTDPDGSIVKYEWDFDGDGNFDSDTGPDPTTSFEFQTQGNYDTVVRVTDDHGGTDTASMSETGGGGLVIDPPNVAPVAALNASPLSGGLPLTVEFDASASTDPDGDPAALGYEWDWEGDGTYDFDSGTTPTAQFVYNLPGSYNPTVRVTDPEGDSDTAALTDTVAGGLDVQDPPVADITATPDTGDAPLTVSFDASGSADSDGTIVQYEWDLNFDGIFETNTGGTDSAEDTYAVKGTHIISVRVTDDDGLVDTASVNITLDTGFIIGEILADVLMDSKASIEAFASSPNQWAGLAYKDANADDLYFVSSNVGVSAWNSPLLVLASGQVGNDCTLKDCGGMPSISFRRAASKLDFIQATAADGTAWWADSVEVDGGGGAGAFTSLAYVNSRPALTNITSGKDDVRYVRAANGDGSSWGTPVTVDGALGGGDEVEFTDLLVVNGNPAIAFNFVGGGSGLKFVRATDADGSAWGSSVTVDVPGGGGRYAALCIVNGNPALSYNAFSVDELRYCRGADASGGTWGTPVTVDSGAGNGQWTSMCVADGVPVIAYYDGGNGDLKFAESADANGAAWSDFVVDNVGNVGQFASMVIVNGVPVIAYYDATNTALKVAVWSN